ncbi:hypothetical protein IAR55_005920 [Kwoniella newhampshirensis]|uniref:Guanyl nucleotide binding protein n=1 Tax=Kwoniella newhampshirensis TaxID=1651941 RepID=A0AAW0YH54_9TREE
MDPPTSGDASVLWPLAPRYDFSSSPMIVGSVDAADLESEIDSNFWRSARWCSDGSAILTNTEDRSLRIHTPSEARSGTFVTQTYEQPDAIHSTLWYPSASVSSPPTFCFMASIRDTPVRLIDASDGHTRATYPIVDHRERFIAPYSMAFNSTSSKLYCGYESAIEVFDIANPGHNTSERLKTAFTKRDKGGQKGIISALAFSSDYSGTFAAGSFSGSASLYSEDTGATPVAHFDGVHRGGVTQLAFHPLNPQMVFVASRRSQEIQVFDIRDLSEPNGTIRVWDIATSGSPEAIFDENLHDDAVGSVQFHPSQPLLLSCAGSRAYLDSDGSIADSSGEMSDDSSSDSAVSEDYWSMRVKSSESTKVIDATLKVWSLAPSTATSSQHEQTATQS